MGRRHPLVRLEPYYIILNIIKLPVRCFCGVRLETLYLSAFADIGYPGYFGLER